jgi:hypothetical protein
MSIFGEGRQGLTGRPAWALLAQTHIEFQARQDRCSGFYLDTRGDPVMR